MSRSNVEFLREIYDLYVLDPAKAIDKLIENMSDKVQWTSVADETTRGLQFAKDRSNHEEVRQYFGDVLKEWEPTGLKIFHFTEQDDRVFVSGRGTWKNRQTGNEVTTKKIDFFRFERGLIVEFQEFFDTGRVAAAAN